MISEYICLDKTIPDKSQRWFSLAIHCTRTRFSDPRRIVIVFRFGVPPRGFRDDETGDEWVQNSLP